MGFFMLGIFGGYAIYFPELFPTPLRSTGTSFCYNVGRFLAASGPWTIGLLSSRYLATPMSRCGMRGWRCVRRVCRGAAGPALRPRDPGPAPAGIGALLAAAGRRPGAIGPLWRPPRSESGYAACPRASRSSFRVSREPRCSNPSAASPTFPPSRPRSPPSGGRPSIYEKSLDARRDGAAVRLLRRPAHGQRSAPPGPLPDPGDQGPLSPLPDDAGLPLRAEGRLGHPRPAGRGRGLQGTGHPLARRRSRTTASSRSSTSARRASCATRKEWEQLTERLGFWIHLDEAYVTYHQSYVESVWWALKNLFDRGLLYQGHKIVWWWAQGGTALSSGEVGQGYREVADPSVYVPFPLLDDAGRADATQPAGLDHHALDAAEQPVRRGPAGPGLFASSRSRTSRGKLIMASALVETIAAKVEARSCTVESTVPRRGAGRPPLRAAVRLLLQDAGRRQPGTAQRRAAASTSPGGSWRPISSPPTAARASSIRRRPSARSTTTCCWPSRPGSSTARARR